MFHLDRPSDHQSVLPGFWFFYGLTLAHCPWAFLVLPQRFFSPMFLVGAFMTICAKTNQVLFLMLPQLAPGDNMGALEWSVIPTYSASVGTLNQDSSLDVRRYRRSGSHPSSRCETFLQMIVISAVLNCRQLN
jgi:hypothetical protein